ncbi:hypothetical protein [Nonomuraea basaltis]|nr:hypothetical protein [Nonomuraea basaltis]
MFDVLPLPAPARPESCEPWPALPAAGFTTRGGPSYGIGDVDDA